MEVDPDERSADGTALDLRSRFVAEPDLSDADRAALRRLLVAAFPADAEAFATASYWGAKPDFRLWLETTAGEPVAHLSLVSRLISVGAATVSVAGVGAVGVRPDRQGRGLGSRLLAELPTVLPARVPAAFGFLACGDALAGFYERAGWHLVHQPMHYVDPDTGGSAVYHGPKLILPAEARLGDWPTAGAIDLRGLPW